MPLQNFTGLDFDQIKQTLKDYLKSNSNFTDYDFDGSNLSTIIDVLAYNTYITSYNANMIANEVFIDSATLRENVVSLARNIGYLPRSKKSSRASITFFVDTSSISPVPSTLVLKKGPVAATSGQFAGQSYVFGITEDKSIAVIDGIATFDNLEVYQGTVVQQSFEYSSRNPFQRFVLPNTGIDLDSLQVSVKPSISSTVSVKYTKQDNLFDSTTSFVINQNSAIYFTNEIEDEQYELVFGDGIFGKKLEDGNIIEVSYIVTDGDSANGISNFTFSGQITYNRNAIEYTVTSGISLISASGPSSGGGQIESIDSVRKYAPQVYSTQNRALTANDYEILIPNKIYPEAESISVFGGEDLIPPQYGKVFISIKPRIGDFVSNSIKENIKRDLRKYAVAGIVPEILDLKYLYVEVDSKVYYNSNLSPNSSFVSTVVQSNINKYAESSELNRYGARLKYSKLLKVIDQSHSSITSNITTIQMRRDLRIALNTFAEYAIDFGNQIHVSSMNGYNIRSSAFKVADIPDDVYLFDIPNFDRKTGTVSFFCLQSPGSNTSVVKRKNIGKIDYVKGRITLNPVNIISGKLKNGQQIMEISTVPHSNDVIGLQDLYLQLDSSRSNIEMIIDQISSGLDPAGSNYKVSSSYHNESIVR
jgi:hypothetical protein